MDPSDVRHLNLYGKIFLRLILSRPTIGGSLLEHDALLSVATPILVPDKYVELFACFHAQLFPAPQRGSLVARKRVPVIVRRDSHPTTGGHPRYSASPAPI